MTDGLGAGAIGAGAIGIGAIAAGALVFEDAGFFFAGCLAG